MRNLNRNLDEFGPFCFEQDRFGLLLPSPLQLFRKFAQTTRVFHFPRRKIRALTTANVENAIVIA
jgi:hypothetical protein